MPASLIFLLSPLLSLSLSRLSCPCPYPCAGLSVPLYLFLSSIYLHYILTGDSVAPKEVEDAVWHRCKARTQTCGRRGGPTPRRPGVGGPMVAGLYSSMSERKPAAAWAAASSALVTVGLLSRCLSVACCAGRPGRLNSGLICSSRMHQTLFGNFWKPFARCPPRSKRAIYQTRSTEFQTR